MKRVIIMGALSVLITGCSVVMRPFAEPETSKPIIVQPGPMGEEDARYIAEQTCIKGGGALTSGGTYNPNSKTWWFDANLNATQPGCNPACVVSELTGTASINWRCTGLIVPTAAEEIQKLFATKYPQYADTLTVTVALETGDYMRGSVLFEQGSPGGIFLALQKDGVWQIAHEGNGAIPCSLKKQGFPQSMLSDCAEAATEMTYTCTPDSRDVEVCTQQYDPVCATVNIQCIKAPCDPITQTYSNSCEACKNALVPSYVKGECGSTR